MIKASDARSWCYCTRRAWYDHRLPPGLPQRDDPFEALITEAGQAHEERIRTSLGGGILAESPAHTKALMAQGVPLIYQPAFEDNELDLEGRPDFLIRNPVGDYQVADAKLATQLKDHPEISLQLALYRRLVGVKELLGHSTIKMTERYAHFSPENVRAAVSVLDSGHNYGHTNSIETEMVKTKALIHLVGGTGFEPVAPAV